MNQRESESELKPDQLLLKQIAVQLEQWAMESRQGGWSTHQVEPQRKLAKHIYEHLGRRPLPSPVADDGLPRAEENPIDMVLYCPACGHQHIDGPDLMAGWDNPPHRSHSCHSCRLIWRPADVPTNGVAAIMTKGKADNWPLYSSATIAAPPSAAEGEQSNDERIAADNRACLKAFQAVISLGVGEGFNFPSFRAGWQARGGRR